MSIEIGNCTISEQPLEPGKETKTGETQIRANKAKSEAGISTTTLTASEHVSTCNVTDTAKMLQSLEVAISQSSVVDPNRIAEVKARIQYLDIFRENTKQQLASAERIANNILSIESGFPKMPKTSAEGD
jgi:hypothetical protein